MIETLSTAEPDTPEPANDAPPLVLPAGVRQISVPDLDHPILANLVMRPVPTDEPIFDRIDPATLLVDESYQRNLSEKSLKLIRRLAEGWDWRKFKPPIVAMTERGFEVVDGQHEATAAVIRGIQELPVIVIDAMDIADRASAFVGHNADRLSVSPVDLYLAGLVARDEKYLQIKEVCDRAGVTVVKVSGSRSWRPGDTVAVQLIGQLINRRGAAGAEQVLSALVAAQLAPVSAPNIKAAELLLFDDEYADQFEVEDLVKTVALNVEAIERKARIMMASHSIPMWHAMAVIWFKAVKKKRRPA